MFYNIYILYFNIIFYAVSIQWIRQDPVINGENWLWIVTTLKPIMISYPIEFDGTCGHLRFVGAKALFQIDAGRISFLSYQKQFENELEALVCKFSIITIVTGSGFTKVTF